MQISGITVLVLFLALFLFILYRMVSSVRKAGEKKAQHARALGFSAVEPDEHLLEVIASVYPRFQVRRQYELRNVFRKHHPDGALYLFDLIDTYGEEDSLLEDQAVAVISPGLRLPALFIFPKSDQNGWVSGLANRALQWVVGRTGDLLEFPEQSEFSKRYVVSASDPHAAREFLAPHLLQQLGGTRLLSIATRGDTFILSSIDLHGRAPDRDRLVERVDVALQCFALFR